MEETVLQTGMQRKMKKEKIFMARNTKQKSNEYFMLDFLL
jgi:hypothetical protein